MSWGSPASSPSQKAEWPPSAPSASATASHNSTAALGVCDSDPDPESQIIVSDEGSGSDSGGSMDWKETSRATTSSSAAATGSNKRRIQPSRASRSKRRTNEPVHEPLRVDSFFEREKSGCSADTHGGRIHLMTKKRYQSAARGSRFTSDDRDLAFFSLCRALAA
jgi:hypothetical protein